STVTEVFDVYYDLDEPVEEPLDNAGFGSSIEQEDELEVPLKKVVTECDALVRDFAPGEKEPVQEPEGEIDIRNNEEEGAK
ncbi:4743_t:CDS:1, partial [Gigaspora rosea]